MTAVPIESHLHMWMSAFESVNSDGPCLSHSPEDVAVTAPLKFEGLIDHLISLSCKSSRNAIDSNRRDVHR
jgi:hypothetical protein